MGKKLQKVMLLVIIMSIVLTSLPGISLRSFAATTQKQIYNQNGITVDFKVSSRWENGFEAQLIITNSSNEPLENWKIKLDFDHEITSLWDGEIESHKGNTYIIKYPTWNTKISSGNKVVLGFNGKLYGDLKFPYKCSILNEKTEVNKDEYTITYKTTSDWEDGFNGEIAIKNNTSTEIEGWTLEFDFEKEIKQFWTAKLVKHENNRYTIKNDEWNSVIKPNQTIKLGFEGKTGKNINEPTNYKLIKAKEENLDEVEYGKELLKDVDKDYDYLHDFEETIQNTDPENPDTDGDGLLDGYEVLILGTNPLKKDTDNNGIMDGEEDFDKDGLNNLYEMKNNLDAFKEDSDWDGLSDYKEIYEYKTSPWMSDSDEDGLEDVDELELKFDPNKADTDGNGTLDGKEKILQNIELNVIEAEKPEVDKISVEMKGTGNIQKNTQIRNIYNMDVMATEVTGLVGIPVDIESTSEFDSAKITFHYNIDSLGNVQEDNLAILWYNEKEHMFVLMEDSVLDKRNQTVSLVTSHFSTYLLVDREVWKRITNIRSSYRSKELFSDNYNVAIVIDSSQSMKGGKLENVKSAASWYVDNLRKKDKCSIVKYVLNANIITSLTSNKASIKKGISSIKINDAKAKNTLNTSGLTMAIEELNRDKTKNKKAIILFCDSKAEVPKEIIDLAKSSKIRIFTVHVGKAAINEPSQAELSKKTIGEYYEGQSLNKMKYAMEDIHHLMEDGINTTDTDNDGLYDVYETKGMLTNNVRIVRTNPIKADTDNDGVNDFDEMTTKETKDYKNGIHYISYENGNGLSVLNRMFQWSSNPGELDTDEDGLLDKTDPAPLVSRCGKKEYKNVNFHYLKINDSGIYVCSKCKHRVKSPVLQDATILSKEDLALMKSYNIYYIHCVALRKVRKQNKETEEEKILLSAMEDIRTKDIYKSKYEYKGKDGCYQRKYSHDSKKFRLFKDVVQITDKNFSYYDKRFWKISTIVLKYLGFMGEICTLIELGLEGEEEGAEVIRDIASDIVVERPEYYENILEIVEFFEAMSTTEFVKGDYVVRIVLDASWATPTAHNVEQNVLEVYYDKNLGIKKYNFIKY